MMREGFNNDLLFIEDQKEVMKFVGVNLGADYCAEHEWGIKGIQSKLGIDVTKLGLDGRKVSKSHFDLHWIEKYRFNHNKKNKTCWSGIYFSYLRDDKGPHIDAYPYEGDLLTLWNENGFCVISSYADKIAKLKEVYDAFGRNDIAIWLGGGGVFKNAGLCIGIASNLPQEITDGWYQYDVEHNQLMGDFRATGIEKKLKDAGRNYFCLKPRRHKDGSLIFWLNPMEQDIYKSGWFNLSDLEAWARNEGSVLKIVKEG